jgi:hypothetical protein
MRKLIQIPGLLAIIMPGGAAAPPCHCAGCF